MNEKLPDKITIYCRPAGKDGIEHAFPINPDSEKRHETARRWASSRGWQLSGGNPFNVYEYNNKGFDNVVIENLEYRGDSGRAYNVTLHHDGHMFKVDLREDALMDIIKNVGIQAGGKLNGTYAFIVGYGQTYLVREDSEAYKKAVNETARAANFSSSPIKKSDLKSGYLYETSSGEQAVYVGEIYSRTIENGTNGQLKFGKKLKSMLFLRAHDKSSLESILGAESFGDIAYKYDIKTSHSFKLEKGKIQDLNLDEVLNFIKKLAQKQYEDSMINNNGVSYRLLPAYRILEVSKNKDLNENQAMIENISNKFKRHGYLGKYVKYKL